MRALTKHGAVVALSNEINVTPMIDVLLVLLIIFMAAIPSMRKSIDVQKADPGLRYAAVVDAMDVARGAGVRVIAWP